MADSKLQREAEVWIREQWLPREFGLLFVKTKLQLSWGGKFEFDGVSLDGCVAVSISTCGGVTSGGKRASPKMNKIRSDALFLLATDVERRVIVLSDRRMFDICKAEQNAGRFPREIEIIPASLPDEMEEALVKARNIAALEVSPVGSICD